MDRLTYAYGTTNANRLRRVDEAAPDDAAYDDIKRAATLVRPGDLFTYDAIGNLVGDGLSGVATINWNVYGKMRDVQHNSLGRNQRGQLTRYRYDAAGNRVAKELFAADPTTGGRPAGGSKPTAAPAAKTTPASGTPAAQVTTPGGGGTPGGWVARPSTTVYYVRDGQGNVLGVYEQARTNDPTEVAPVPALAEQPLYGSARLGERLTRNVALADPAAAGPAPVYTRLLGTKRYELADHLGNVRAVVSDELRAAGGPAPGLVPALLSYHHYYPFGQEQPGRSAPANATLAGGYRYGFNGKEKDNNGELGLTNYDYGFRIYNPGLGRFLSVDPLTSKYPMLTTYQFAGNSPITFIDLDGLEPTYPKSLSEAVAVIRIQTAEENAKSPESSSAFSLSDYRAMSYMYRINFMAKNRLKKHLAYPDFYGTQFSTKPCAYDCITAVGQAVRVLNDNFAIPIYGGEKGNMREYLTNTAERGFAGPEKVVDFNRNSNGGITSMKNSLASMLLADTNQEEGYHLFGVALNAGEHSVLVGVQIGSKGSNPMYSFFDNDGLPKSTVSGEVLDNYLVRWTQNLNNEQHNTYYRKLINTNVEQPVADKKASK